MQTNFTPEQLRDPMISDANEILRNCVHCGFCIATCPTYLLLGDELDGPRGRIYLIKEMLEQNRPASVTDVKHIDRCLSCFSCMTTCPSGVNYKNLLDYGRQHISKTFKRTFYNRIFRKTLGVILPHKSIFAFLIKLFCWLKPVLGIIPIPIKKFVDLVPNKKKYQTKVLTPFKDTPDIRKKYRIGLLNNCVQQSLVPSIEDATVRILERHGCEVISTGGCCGALNHQLGQEKETLKSMVENINSWYAVDSVKRLDAIIVNVSGCGTMVKDYGFFLRNNSEFYKKAKRISAITQDITEFLSKIKLKKPVINPGFKVAYQAPCSLSHGQKVIKEPVLLLEKCGFEVFQPRDQHQCCGSAGTYNLLQNEIATSLRDKKVSALAALAPETIASGNIGCITQLNNGRGTKLPCAVVHTVELLDWATGGPFPSSIK